MVVVFPALVVASSTLPRFLSPYKNDPQRLLDMSVTIFVCALAIYIDSLVVYLNWESIGDLSTFQQDWLVELPAGLVAVAAAAVLVKALLDGSLILDNVANCCIVFFAIFLAVNYIMSPLISWFW